jgi:hypothetical protein
VGIQAEAGIHLVAVGTGNSGEDLQEVGMASLVGEEACLVRRGKVALAFRGRLGVGSCLVGDRRGEACRALGAFRACRRVEVVCLEKSISLVVDKELKGYGGESYRLGMRREVVG